MSDQGHYSIGLDKTPANFVALSPLSFLERSAAVYPNLPSAVYEGRVFTWSQTYERCRRFASFLAKRGIGRGDTVAAMLPNIPAMNELHFAVPMTGAVLNTLNIRLEAGSGVENGDDLQRIRIDYEDLVADQNELITAPIRIDGHDFRR